MKQVFSARVLGKYSAEFEWCMNCGFLRVANPHWLEEAYSSAIAAADTGLVMRNINVARRLAGFLYFVLPGRGAGRYLDVAGGYGMLTRLMRDYGFDFYWSDKYCSNLLAPGFEFDVGNAPCQAVTAIEVMEHLIDPVEFVVEALKMAQSNTFIFTTELYHGEPPRPEQWSYYSLSTGQHISFFTNKALTVLSERLEMNYHYLAGMHIFTRQRMSPMKLKLFSKKAMPLMLKILTGKMKGRSLEDHDQIVAKLSRSVSGEHDENAFDCQVFLFQEYGGISRYICRLASSLNSLEGVEAKIFAPLHRNAYLADMPASMVKGRDVRHWRKSKKLFRVINATSSRLLMRINRPDVVHETYYSSTFVAPKGVPLVVTVHDMIHEKFPEMFSRKDQTSNNKRTAVEKADHVICVSENTRKDLLEHFGTAEEKVSVVYHGLSEFGHRLDMSNRLMPVALRPYFLYVGQRSGYKNFARFIRAFASSRELRHRYRVVCFGGGVFRPEEWSTFHQLGLEKAQTVQVGGDDWALAHCYKNAFALVYPSLYEGFGIPPLEAMSLDCPVVSSCSSSIPEVAGPAAEYFDPASIDSIREGLERVAMSSDRRAELVQLGRRRYQQFTWKRCAQETLAIYKSLI